MTTSRATQKRDNSQGQSIRDGECPAYLIITPVRNEERFISETLRSVARQTILPREWIIVDDGSSDRTPEIVSEFAGAHPWVRLVQRADRGKRALGAGVVEAFNFGYDHLSISDYDFIVKLDGDLSFEPTYFEELFRRFTDNPRLGIASGKTYVQHGEELVVERCDDHHSRGMTKVYRRVCFEEIGGLRSTIGWDSVDELYAQYHGWETRSFADLVLVHYRPMGTSHGSALRGKVRWGKGRYVTGSHPLFVLASGVYRMTEPPYGLGGLALIYGYFNAWLTGHPKVPEPEVRRFQRQRELRRLSPRNLWRFLRNGRSRSADVEIHDLHEPRKYR